MPNTQSVPESKPIEQAGNERIGAGMFEYECRATSCVHNKAEACTRENVGIGFLVLNTGGRCRDFQPE